MGRFVHSGWLKVILIGLVALTLVPLSAGAAYAATPMAQDDDLTFLTGDTTYDVPVAANDVGTDDAPLQYTLGYTSSEGEITFADPSQGVATVTFPEPASGWDYAEFEYTVTDADGEQSSAWAYVSFVDAVALEDDSVDVPLDVATDLDVLSNDDVFEPDFTVAVETQPSHGTATVNSDGSIKYDPTDGYQGDDYFDYRVTDSNGETATAGVYLNVTPPLVLEDDSASTVLTEPAVVNPLENDTIMFEVASIEVAQQPANGAAAWDGDTEELTYVADEGFSGTDSFQYRVTDVEGNTATAMVTVSVTNAILSAGPLTRVVVDNDLNCAVNHVDDSQGEFYGDTACGTFLAVGNQVFSPAEIPAGDPGTPWTSVEQTRLTGNGTEATPYKYTTTVAAGDTGISLVQTDSYVVGEESYKTDIEVINNGAARTVQLYRAGDCYLADSDDGLGAVDESTGAVSCVSSVSDRVEQFFPLSSGSRYYEAGYYQVWDWINTRTPFPNTCRCADDIDNGAGLSWEIELPAGGSVTKSSLITFSPTGVVPLSASSTVTPATVEPGGTVTYTATVSNPGAAAVTLQSVTDTLPAGFSYVAGTSSGTTTSEPAVDGRNLTWSGPGLDVPAGGELSITFDAVATSTPGTYRNEVSADAPDTFVNPSGPTAPVTVAGAADTTPPGPVQNLVATPGDGSVTLSWLNPSDPDLASIIVRYAAGSTAPSGPDQGTGVDLGSPLDEGVSVTGLTNGTQYSFAVFARDTSGNTSDPAVASARLNQRPAAVDDSASTNVATPKQVQVLLNDSDADGHPLAISGHTDGAHGSVECSTDACTYTPESGFTGEDTFTYTVSDGHGGSDTATVTMTVLNRGPVAVDDSASTDAGTAKQVQVLVNDSDADGHALVITGHTDGADGSVACSSDACTYTPDAGFDGEDSFTYTVSDGHGGSDTATVTMTVVPAAVTPTAVSIAGPAAVSWPDLLTITGMVTATGGDYDGPVELWGKRAGGAWAELATVTASAGAVSFEERPSTRTTYQWRVPGTDVQSTEKAVAVKPWLSAGADSEHLSVNEVLEISGDITPTRDGAPLKLQKKEGTRWETIDSTTVAATDSTEPGEGAAYSFEVDENASGVFRYRVLAPADAGRAKVTSEPVDVSFYKVSLPSHRSTGDEFLKIKNPGSVVFDLEGWTIKTQNGTVLTLPAKQLDAGDAVKIHPGTGRSDRNDLYLGGAPAFRDAHDTLKLRNLEQVVVAKRVY